MMSGRNTTLIVSVIVGLAFVMAVPYPASAEETAAAQAPESLTLDDAIATALELNPRLHEAEQNLRAARATVVQARAGKSLTANLEVVRTHVSDVAEFVLPVPAPPPEYISFEQVTFGRKDQTQGTLTVAKPLYTGGAVPAAVRQASAGVSAQSEQLTRVRQSVVNDVKQAYYGVLLAADLVRVAEQTVDAAGEYVRLAQAIFDAGTAPRFDVLRAETRLAESEQLLIQ
ncbi:MAG: TolC family protein, partial [Armatimonadota bacterium]